MQTKQDTDRRLFLQLNTTLVFVTYLLKLIYAAVQLLNYHATVSSSMNKNRVTTFSHRTLYTHETLTFLNI